MARPSRARNPRPGGRRWQALCAVVRAEESVCWLCGRFVNLTVPYTNPVTLRPNPGYGSVDHVELVKTHPDLAWDRANLRLCHLGCNLRRGDRTAHKAQRPQSRAW